MFVCACLSVCLPACKHACLSACVSIYLSQCLCVCVCVCLPVCLHMHTCCLGPSDRTYKIRYRTRNPESTKSRMMTVELFDMLKADAGVQCKLTADTGVQCMLTADAGVQCVLTADAGAQCVLTADEEPSPKHVLAVPPPPPPRVASPPPSLPASDVDEDTQIGDLIKVGYDDQEFHEFRPGSTQLPQCKLVWQRRHGYGPSWKKSIGKRNVDTAELLEHSSHFFFRWFQARPGMLQKWSRPTCDIARSCLTCSWVGEKPDWVTNGVNHPTAYHGTKFYNLWNITINGLQPSLGDEVGRALGHDNHTGITGVFVAPDFSTSFGEAYATPQNLFGTGIYYSVVLQVIVNEKNRLWKSTKGGWEQVFAPNDICLHALIVTCNRGVSKGQARLQGFEPELEDAYDSQGNRLRPEGTVRGPRLFSAWY